MRLAVGQALALVVTVAQEGLLALGAHKVLHVPVLAWKWIKNTYINDLDLAFGHEL